MTARTIFRKYLWLLCLLVLSSLLTGAIAVQAQADQILNLGENKTGELTELVPVVRYIIPVATPTTANVQIFAITPGLTLSLRVLDAAGVAIQTQANAGNQTLISATPAFSNPGFYTLEIQSANAAFGQYLISVQAGAPLLPPTPLGAGQTPTGTVTNTSPRQAYTFTADPLGVLVLNVQSNSTQSGPVVLIKDATTGETLGSSTSRLLGARFRLPSGGGNYLLEVLHSGGAFPEDYVVCLEREGFPSVCPVIGQLVPIPTAIPTLPQNLPPVLPSPTLPLPTLPPLPATGPCIVASATGGSVNVRSGPGTDFQIVGQINGSTTLPVIAVLPDGSWYQVNRNGFPAWIASSVIRLGGICSAVPAVTLTPTATLAGPTLTPTATTNATPTPTSTATDAATATATATATDAPPPVATLNFSLPPVFGSTSLTSGFVPDPFNVGVTAGGPAGVSYLGGGCSGFATSAPSFSVNYTAGAFPTLRFYFVGGGDTTMIINTPGGSYVCVDDSFGTVDPTTDFSAPSSGRYDVWIATFAEGGSIGGTLFVTENTANHP